jgi:RNA polymerase sigma-70 factor (ECF subfamily)
MLDQISMAFLVVLQRLTPAERAVLLLRDVFDFDYEEIARLVGKTQAACRKLLERAHEHVATEKRLFAASPEVHQRLLAAFTQAATAGDLDALVGLLAADALLISDGGPEGRRVGGIRNLQVPLQGAAQIAAFVTATSRVANLQPRFHELNGQPAVVFYDGDIPFAALLLAVADDRIHRVFFHSDAGRLRYLGVRRSPSS